MKLYLAGPMFHGVENFGPIFAEAERELTEAGYEVLNPLRHGAGEGDWIHYLKLTIPDVLKSDGVALLPRWRQSRGAKLEMYIASELEIPGRMVEDWLLIAQNS